ncbi:MAG: HYR domain-containing protein [Gaiellaceae bacterium]
MFGKLAVLGLVLGLFFIPVAQGATTDTAKATVSPGPYVVGVPITLTSSPCTVLCQQIWTFLNGTRLGDRIGVGEQVNVTFDTPGLKTIELDLSEFCVGTTRLTCDSFDFVTVNVGDVAPPTDSTSPKITASGLDAEATGPTTIVNYAFAATDPDDPVVSTTCSPSSGSAFAVGSTPIDCSAVDSNGNVGKASFAVVVSDTTKPVLTLPGTQTAEATSAAGAVVSFAASATDLVDGTVATTCSPASGATFSLGLSTVTCTAADAQGNPTSGSFSVDVTDTTKPSLSLPGTITVDPTSPDGTAVSYTATASDAVDGAITPSCSPASGATFPIGSTTVACSATDAHDNLSSGSFAVVVAAAGAPTVTVPAAIVVDATSPLGAVVTYTATAADAFGAALTPSCSNESGSLFPIGTTTVSCTATDAGGTSAAARTFSVTVKGAVEQLQDLLAVVRSWKSRSGVGSHLRNVIRDFSQSPSAGCTTLADLQSDLSGALGQNLTPERLTFLLDELARISNVAGCSPTQAQHKAKKQEHKKQQAHKKQAHKKQAHKTQQHHKKKHR